MQNTIPTYGVVLLTAAFAVPSLLGVTTIVSPSLLNQVAAWVFWGTSIFALSKTPTLKSKNLKHLAPAYALLVTLVVAICLSASLTAVPNERTWAALGAIVGASLVFHAGAVWRASGHLRVISLYLAVGILVGATANSIFGHLQIFAPEQTGTIWIAASPSQTRAAGNLRQPNHMALLLLWGLASLVILLELGKISKRSAFFLTLVICSGLALTASRTGYLGVVLLLFWAVIDRQLKQASRLILVTTPFLVAATWLLSSQIIELMQQTSSLDPRLSIESAGTRLEIWRDSLVIIEQNPWWGVGWGEFNFAWTLTPFPHRPTEYVDNAHNLILHLAAELGLPVMLLVCILFTWIAFNAATSAKLSSISERTLISAILAMIALVFMHSLLEYPLWFTYFLFPTALFVGLCLAQRQENAEQTIRYNKWQLSSGLVLAFAGWFLLHDAGKASQVTHPPDFEAVAPLAERIATGRQSLIYTSVAELGWATRNAPGSNTIDAAYKAAHGLLETNVMMVWISSLHETGDYRRARYLAERLREFNRADANAMLNKWEKNKASSAYFSASPDSEMNFRSFRKRW